MKSAGTDPKTDPKTGTRMINTDPTTQPALIQDITQDQIEDTIMSMKDHIQREVKKENPQEAETGQTNQQERTWQTLNIRSM